MSTHTPLRVWDNAAFGGAGAPGAGGAGPTWLPLRPIGVDPAKENRSPNTIKKPLATGVDDDDVDAEIEEAQREIARLSKKLHLLLKIKKADAATTSTSEAIPPLPPPPQQQKRVVQEPPGSRHGRGMSLGPIEVSRIANASSIAAPLRPGTGRRKPTPRKLQGVKEEEKGSATTMTTLRRRETSIGPAEMFSASRSQVRRKSSVQEAARSASSSPKPRRAAVAAAASKAAELRKGVSTVGAKKPVGRRVGPTSRIEPKALFQKAESPVVPNATSPSLIMKVAATLPKIRTLRRCGAAESPRDSGCAKRVAELVGRRSFFAADDDDGGGSGSSSPCRNLNFDNEERISS